MTPRLIRDPAFPRLKDFVIEATGLAYYDDKDNDLADRIARRMAELGLQDGATYLVCLESSDAELDALIAELTVGETYFFRHGELFDALRGTVLPDLIEKNRESRRLRIWSAGCATGAEPYSLAILLKREFARQIAGWAISIVGTDINRKFLARAREGRFEAWALRATPDDLWRSCFSQSGKSWIVAPEYREWVSFQYHNLVTDPFPSLLNDLAAFDLILCRNVMIYFDRAVIQKLIQQFYQCLVSGGWLAVGHAESHVELFRPFRTVNIPGVTLYQKSGKESGDTEAFWGRIQDKEPKGAGASTVHSPFPLAVPDGAPREEKARSPCRRLPSEKAGKPSVPSFPTLDDIRLLSGRGEYEKALNCCQELLEKAALDPLLHFYHALVLEHIGSQKEAEGALRRAIYLDRNFVLAHYYLGLFLQKKEDLQGAERAFQNALKLLSRMDGEQHVGDGEDLRAGDLKKSTEMHLEVLRNV